MVDLIALQWPKDGAGMAQHIIDQARADANAGARQFWVRLQFSPETSTSDGDGQTRHVHPLKLLKEPEHDF